MDDAEDVEDVDDDQEKEEGDEDEPMEDELGDLGDENLAEKMDEKIWGDDEDKNEIEQKVIKMDLRG